ncbi:glucose N-acetyltransferase [Poronia punctata]|nr:glucose N-acetyltransferase [Poronia punctata]
MAPLWGSSWSSTWGSLSGYTQVQSKESESTSGGDALKPSLAQILTSKRIRYTGSALAIVGLFFLAFHNYEQLPSMANMRGSTSGSSSVVDPNKDCPPAVVPSFDSASVDWSRYAYTQYVTNKEYLCNSVMIFETLHRLKAKAELAMMYPDYMMDPKETNPDSAEAKLLVKARDKYNVKLEPVSIQRRNGGDATWAESFTKLLAFNQTQYQRVLHVDSDATILQTMDELFLLPPCPVAMPRAYWLFPKDKILSSQLMLLQPSEVEFDRVMKKVESSANNDYDMEIVNQLYGDTAMILPHRPYDLLTGEFRGENHENYLGTDREEFDPITIYNEAKYLHFSDWPAPKPWISMSEGTRQSTQPQCVTKDGREDCTARDLWNGFYSEFSERRSKVCDTSSRSRR